jgi:hypothetical protein
MGAEAGIPNVPVLHARKHELISRLVFFASLSASFQESTFSQGSTLVMPGMAAAEMD